MLRKQAKVVSSRELKRLLDYAAHGRYPERDRVLVLLSFKAGFRAKEIAGLRWSMVTDTSGELVDQLALPDRASKGRNGGRVVPMHRELRDALAILMVAEPDKVRPNRPVIYSERGSGYSSTPSRSGSTLDTRNWVSRAPVVIPADAASSPRRRARSSKPAARCAMCKNWPGTRASRPPSATSKATARQSGK
jgi:integrase